MYNGMACGKKRKKMSKESVEKRKVYELGTSSAVGIQGVKEKPHHLNVNKNNNNNKK